MLDKEIISDYINKMLEANKIGLELDLFGTPRYHMDGDFLGIELFLAEHKGKHNIIPMHTETYNFLVISYDSIKRKKLEIEDAVYDSFFEDCDDVFEMDDEEYNRRKELIKKADRKPFEEKWLDDTVSKISKRIEKMNF